MTQVNVDIIGADGDEGPVAVTAYDGAGENLLTLQNSNTRGVEFFGFATQDGSPLIKGVLVRVAGPDFTPKYLVQPVVTFVVSSFVQGCCA